MYNSVRILAKAEARGPLWLLGISKPKALLVVTHPDDETIFAGGLLLCSRQTKWTVICVEPQTTQRKNEFISACQFLAKESGNYINPILLEPVLDMDTLINASWLVEELKPYATEYDFVLTHNREGEYGHPNHKLVHRCVIDSIANSNIWVFISPGSKNVNQEELKSKKTGGNFTLNLSPQVQRLKIRAFQECHVSQAEIYGYDKTGKLRDTDLRETLLWEFESGKEKYTFYR